MKRHIVVCLLGVLGAAELRAESGSLTPDQVWFMSYSKGQRAWRQARYGLPEYVDGTSRLEAELQASAKLSHLAEIRRKLNALVRDPAQAEALLGRGFRLVRTLKKPRDVWDSYRDTHDGLLASTGASLRIRSENQVDKINFKPPTSVRFPNGVAHRVELGANVLPTSDAIGFSRNRRLRDNPLRELPSLYRGRDVADFFAHALEIKQKRTIYEVHRLDEHGNPSKVAEMTVDRVTARKTARSRKEIAFGRVELEGDHITLKPTAEQAARAAKSLWKGPHRARDTKNPALVGSPEVKEVHRLSEIMTRYLGVTPSGMSKYAEARSRLGMRGRASGAKARVGR